ncbi:MAG TPA: hypothetical protein VFQ53_24445 [Kofleriaceae bacterium]|nr:hypothetical protein [Kofleriaceae bacterium]
MRARLFVALSSLAACGGLGGSTDVEPTLRFSDRTDIEISRLVNAASGSEGFQAQAQVHQFDDPFEPEACPNLVEDVTRVTITGGCTRVDGTQIEGAATINNPVGWGELDYDYGSDSVYTFEQLAFVRTGGDQVYDGTFRIGPSYQLLDMDLTTESFGVIVRSDIHMECDGTTCEIGNSGIELVDAGGALVSGSIAVSGSTATGHITMRGADTVTVTIAQGCVAWRLEGTDREFSPCN